MQNRIVQLEMLKSSALTYYWMYLHCNNVVYFRRALEVAVLYWKLQSSSKGEGTCLTKFMLHEFSIDSTDVILTSTILDEAA